MLYHSFFQINNKKGGNGNEITQELKQAQAHSFNCKA